MCIKFVTLFLLDIVEDPKGAADKTTIIEYLRIK